MKGSAQLLLRRVLERVGEERAEALDQALDGARIDFMTAAVHQVLFWILNSVLTPFVLLVGLFTDRNRLLHDILLGTAMADRQLIHLNP